MKSFCRCQRRSRNCTHINTRKTFSDELTEKQVSAFRQLLLFDRSQRYKGWLPVITEYDGRYIRLVRKSTDSVSIFTKNEIKKSVSTLDYAATYTTAYQAAMDVNKKSFRIQ